MLGHTGREKYLEGKKENRVAATREEHARTLNRGLSSLLWLWPCTLSSRLPLVFHFQFQLRVADVWPADLPPLE